MDYGERAGGGGADFCLHLVLQGGNHFSGNKGSVWECPTAAELMDQCACTIAPMKHESAIVKRCTDDAVLGG